VKKLLIACAALALFPACANTHRLNLRSDPDGAEISIIKKGQIQTRGKVHGIVAIGTADLYEDQPVVIGRSPMAYDVLVVEHQSGFRLPGIVSTSQDKVCQQVTIRATKDGRYAEQTIPVSRGEIADVYLQLSPAAPAPPPGQPAPAHTASPVQQPRS
jgi:hypothetical protein